PRLMLILKSESSPSRSRASPRVGVEPRLLLILDPPGGQEAGSRGRASPVRPARGRHLRRDGAEMANRAIATSVPNAIPVPSPSLDGPRHSDRDSRPAPRRRVEIASWRDVAAGAVEHTHQVGALGEAGRPIAALPATQGGPINRAKGVEPGEGCLAIARIPR